MMESEQRVARQYRVVQELVNEGHDAERAMQVLNLYEWALELQRAVLLILQRAAGAR